MADVAALPVQVDVIVQPVLVVSVAYVDETLDGRVEYLSAALNVAASNHNSLTYIFVRNPFAESLA